jgi:hypothetical protein
MEDRRDIFVRSERHGAAAAAMLASGESSRSQPNVTPESRRAQCEISGVGTGIAGFQ